MVCKLSKIIAEFPGLPHLTCCFTHVLNLVAKTAICIFDVPAKDKDTDLDQADIELHNLTGNIELEEGEAQELDMENNDEEEDDLTDSTEGWIDERAELSMPERAELDALVLHARLVLVKVCH